ncbi:MAG: hypothetical protein IID33_09905, partial [Planctomycetes bacterium]|nr:hypothetical protein [Planctomycetota bacterium]
EADRTATSQPASRSARSPFGAATAKRRPGARPGVVHLSNGDKLPGWISTTTAKPLKLFERETRRYLDLPLDRIAVIETRLDWERMEDDWRWAEQGSDIKVRTGKKYPARKTYYVVKTADGRTITADMRIPLWIERAGKTRRLILHARDKGPPETTLDQLIYVTRVELSEERMREALAAITPDSAATQPASTQPGERP